MTKTKSPPAATTAPVPAGPVSSLPVYECLGLAKVDGGWTVALIKTQGDRVLSTEVIEPPTARAVALEALKLAVVRRLMAPKI